MNKIPDLPNYGKHLILRNPKKRIIWKIYRHPDKVLDNLAIVEKINPRETKPDKRWIVAKDYADWVISLLDNGYICKSEED